MYMKNVQAAETFFVEHKALNSIKRQTARRSNDFGTFFANINLYFYFSSSKVLPSESSISSSDAILAFCKRSADGENICLVLEMFW